jgi:NADH-quinone oxidoreductase subunit L
MHHEQDMRYMGGLRRYMPITWITMWIGTLALTGMPGFAGFFSKDAIIEAVHESHLGAASTYAYWCVLLGVFVTALYSFRLLYLTFHGRERFVVEHGDHGHHGHHESGHLEHPPHESPWVVTVPLILLAIPSIVIGAATVGSILHGDYFGSAIVTHEHEASEFPGWMHLAAEGLGAPPFILAFLGFAVATYVYLLNPQIADKVKTAVLPLWRLLYNKYWIDELYQATFARGSLLLGRGLWKGGDVGVIDNVLIDGSAAGVGRIAATVRWVQTGYLYTYAFAMILGLVVLLGGLWFVVART